MSHSHRIARVVGPTLMVVSASEFPLVQPGLYAQTTPPFVYLSGLVWFILGLCVVQVHNIWVRGWPVLITLAGWSFLLLGVLRMFSATRYHQHVGTAESWPYMLIEASIFLIGVFLSIKAYASAN